MRTVVWVDATAGASGDMLLGALVDAGVPLEVLEDAARRVAPEEVRLTTETVRRAGLAAIRCHVEVADSATHRTWRDVRRLLDEADLDPEVEAMATRVFTRLASAEAGVHGVDVDDVHFHEVGALDAIADVVGVCAGFAHLRPASTVVSTVAVGSGRIHGAHGSLPVPPPAVAALLTGLASTAGPGTTETCTPTGAALLAELADDSGPQPAMTVRAVGVGAGGRDPETHANVVRLLVGEAAPPAQAQAQAPAQAQAQAEAQAQAQPRTPAQPQAAATPGAIVIESNVDDLDPRLWPHVLAALLAAGASDAWLTPILMKKGRPAHTLSVLVRADRLPAVRRVVFQETSTIGVREVAVGKTALDREMRSVTVDGHEVPVKIARLDGEVMNLQPEYDDVAAVARATGRPVKDVLAEASAKARDLHPESHTPEPG